MRLTILLLLCLPFCWAQARKTIFMITDAEGVAGVCRQDQTEPKDSEMRQLLTGEINADVDGFLSGGADEEAVLDRHDGIKTISAPTYHHLINPLVVTPGADLTI